MGYSDNGVVDLPPVGPGGLLPDTVGSPEIIDGQVMSIDIGDGEVKLIDVDAAILDRANHTGTQTLLTISDSGTAAPLDVPAAGDAAVTEVVKGTDTRLTDDRTDATRVSKAGDTMTGDLTMSGPDPILKLLVPGGDNGLFWLDGSLGANALEARIGSVATGTRIFSGLILTESMNLGKSSGQAGGKITHFSPSSVASVIVAKVQGESQERMRVTPSGLVFGDGTLSPDWEMERIGLSTMSLKAGDTLQIRQDAVLANDLVRLSQAQALVAAGDLDKEQQYITALGVTAVAAATQTVIANAVGAIDPQLPAAPTKGRRIAFTRYSPNGGGNIVTIQGNGKNIAGGATFTLVNKYSSVILEFSTDVNEWIVL